MLFRKATYFTIDYNKPYLSHEALAAHQLKRLRYVVARAYRNVPYYRNLFDQTGILPVDINTLQDIRKIPITRKDAVRNLDIAFRVNQRASIDKLVEYETSGTTGQKMTIYCSKRDSDRRVSTIFRTYVVHGYQPWHKIAVFQFFPIPESLSSKFKLFKRISIPFELSIADQIEMLQKIQPQVLEGYPSRLNLLSEKIMRENIIGIKPKLVFTNSEKITSAIRRKLLRAFGVEPIDVYDCWECGNIAWECDTHEGLHINADQVYVEIVTENQVVADGDPGEIVITDLYNQTMPLIRYAIGDIGTKKKSLCSCGRNFPLLEMSVGRGAEMIYLHGGDQKVSASVVTSYLDEQKGFWDYQIVQYEYGEIDVKVVLNKQLSIELTDQLEKKICTKFKLDRATIKCVGQIDRTAAGKAKDFISMVDDGVHENPKNQNH